MPLELENQLITSITTATTNEAGKGQLMRGAANERRITGSCSFQAHLCGPWQAAECWKEVYSHLPAPHSAGVNGKLTSSAVFARASAPINAKKAVVAPSKMPRIP